MKKEKAIKFINKLNEENSELIKQLDYNKSIIAKLKRDHNIGCTLLDESLLDYYKSEARAMNI